MCDIYIIYSNYRAPDTYDHRLRKTGHPVRSAILKPQIGRLVVGWVTTSESLLLYVFAFLMLLIFLILLMVGNEMGPRKLREEEKTMFIVDTYIFG